MGKGRRARRLDSAGHEPRPRSRSDPEAERNVAVLRLVRPEDLAVGGPDLAGDDRADYPKPPQLGRHLLRGGGQVSPLALSRGQAVVVVEHRAEDDRLSGTGQELGRVAEAGAEVAALFVREVDPLGPQPGP